MWIEVKDKTVIMPSSSSIILVTDGKNYQLISVEKFLENVDKPYNTWTHWMKIPVVNPSINKKHINELAKKHIGKYVSDCASSFDPDTVMHMLDGYLDGFEKGYCIGKED